MQLLIEQACTYVVLKHMSTVKPKLKYAMLPNAENQAAPGSPFKKTSPARSATFREFPKAAN